MTSVVSSDRQARFGGLFSGLPPREYLAHMKRETLEVLVSDPRLLYGTFALLSLTAACILAWPGEILDGPAFRIINRYMNDTSLMLAFLLHMVGMLRAIFKLKERPAVDLWTKRLGFALFFGVALAIDLSLRRVTFLSGFSFGLALVAFGLMFTKNRAPAGVTP